MNKTLSTFFLPMETQSRQTSQNHSDLGSTLENLWLTFQRFQLEIIKTNKKIYEK
jgi:hypothetical protein